jgi:hypothetical protein
LAQATFEDALDIYRDVFPTDMGQDACMAQMTETHCSIGSIQNKCKNVSGVIESLRKALDFQQGIMGHNNPWVIAPPEDPVILKIEQMILSSKGKVKGQGCRNRPSKGSRCMNTTHTASKNGKDNKWARFCTQACTTTKEETRG